ncbi:hypothetical protein Pmani_032922 [Petrolisthes manimaculis]|uniref:Uncharacterized protein n=1 Tax=Petrolisthes manimaculis TaxID=1843537 RepID=A0AAE1TTA2_9EUCA|nr:hypothetical protein Pmani_032922 [Petrolisthes manimaculis]
MDTGRRDVTVDRCERRQHTHRLDRSTRARQERGDRKKERTDSGGQQARSGEVYQKESVKEKQRDDEIE